MSTPQRIFDIVDFVQPSSDTPIRSVMLETPDSVVVVWHARPGQEIAPHLHPAGQDTWIVISGSAQYYQGNGVRRPLVKGQVAVARPGEVHGALNEGSEDFVFVSVVSSGAAGYEPTTP
ncbi:MAG TPA: cupin domain-containing protein [Rhodocyclaceae bacterium]|nr:cupin domain-containing protein [Rhodocyclaceae bacterium]